MKRVHAFPGVVLVALVGAGFSVFGLSTNPSRVIAKKEQPVDIQSQILGELHTRFLRLSNASFKQIDCKPILITDTSKSTVCFVSGSRTEELLPVVQQSLQEIARTSGWSQDYGVWGAFYALKDRPKWTFGVNLESVKDSEDFEGIEEVKGFESFVTVTVSSQPKP